MAAFPRTIAGKPGTRIRNGTGRPMYQLVCELVRTCNFCLPYHCQVATSPWPVPFHFCCRCRVLVIKPGADAPHPLPDYSRLVRSLPDDQQAIALGKSNYRLWKAGTVNLDDIVEPGRIRSATEVVARLRIPLKKLEGAGLSDSTARRLYDAAKGAAGRDWAAHHRRELDERIAAAHAAQAAVTRHIGAAMTRAAGQVAPSPAANLAAPAPPSAAARLAHAAELAKMLGSPSLISKAKATVGRVVKAVRSGIGRLLGRGQPILPAKPAGIPAPTPPIASPPRPAPVSPSRATLTYADEGWDRIAAKLFGRKMSAEDIINMAGAPHGAASITVVDDDLVVVVRSPEFAMTRYLRRIRGGDRPEVVAEAFHVAEGHQGRGIGADVFGRMIESARKSGAARIATHAVRTPGENGYYTWPRFGYDGDLAAGIRAKLPADLEGATRVSDLMKTPEGSAWWKAHGESMHLTFDLEPGSRSLRAWEAYREAKAAQQAANP